MKKHTAPVFFSMLLPLGSDSIAKQDEIYNVQKEVIREMAEKESCIIVGRCADYILKDNPDTISVFCFSNLEERIRFSINEYDVPAKQAKKIVQEKI